MAFSEGGLGETALWPPKSGFPQKYYLLLHIRRGLFAGDAAKHDDVSHSVAAQAVGAVDAAGDFARREEAGDDLAVSVQHMGFGVDLQAAHGVVDARGDLHGIIRRGVQRRAGPAQGTRVPEGSG